LYPILLAGRVRVSAFKVKNEASTHMERTANVRDQERSLSGDAVLVVWPLEHATTPDGRTVCNVPAE